MDAVNFILLVLAVILPPLGLGIELGWHAGLNEGAKIWREMYYASRTNSPTLLDEENKVG